MKLGETPTITETLLAERRSHLIRESAGDNHAIGLPRARAEYNPKAIQIVARGAGVHHLDGAAGQAERHRPDGAAADIVHEIIDLRDDEFRRLGHPRRRGARRWEGGRVRRRRGGGSCGERGGGGVDRS